MCMGGVGHGVGESGMGSGRVLATATNLASVPNLAQPHIDSRNELENQPQFACLQSAVTAGGRVCVLCHGVEVLSMVVAFASWPSMVHRDQSCDDQHLKSFMLPLIVKVIS